MPAGAAGARISRDESYAIISARISNIGCIDVRIGCPVITSTCDLTLGTVLS